MGTEDRNFLLAILTAVGAPVTVELLACELVRVRLLAQDPTGGALPMTIYILNAPQKSITAQLARNLRVDPGFVEVDGKWGALL